MIKKEIEKHEGKAKLTMLIFVSISAVEGTLSSSAFNFLMFSFHVTFFKL